MTSEKQNVGLPANPFILANGYVKRLLRFPLFRKTKRDQSAGGTN
jgi:hypothetical protein